MTLTAARRIFFWAAVYGVAVLLPQYFLEERLGRDYPPPISHPEQFYGFLGTALAWQAAFFVIARDPARYRLLMLPAVMEKLLFGGAVVVLLLQGRVAPVLAGFAGIELLLAGLFGWAFLSVPRSEQKA